MIKLISRNELRDMMQTGQQIRIVDVLPRESFEKVHIRGAISIPLDEIEEKAPKVLRKDEEVVVYCASFECQASTEAAEKLSAMGYTKVLDYKGGLKDYREADLPLAGRFHEPKSCVGSTCSTC